MFQEVSCNLFSGVLYFNEKSEKSFLVYIAAEKLLLLYYYTVRQACILLRDTDLSVRVIAHSVSYADPLYFSIISR